MEGGGGSRDGGWQGGGWVGGRERRGGKEYRVGVVILTPLPPLTPSGLYLLTHPFPPPSLRIHSRGGGDGGALPFQFEQQALVRPSVRQRGLKLLRPGVGRSEFTLYAQSWPDVTCASAPRCESLIWS